MKSESEKLVKKHRQLTQSDNMKVMSHVQRDEGEWVRNTIMIESVDVPFIYRRKLQYQSLKGARVNITYYPNIESVAGMEFETMKVVRLKRS